MNYFKKLDRYLLHQFPSIWVTRLHVFLPIGLALILLIFLLNLSGGWNPKEEFPDDESFTFLMVIPVLVYLVYWFIFQSRYNIVKSGGKVSYFVEYISFLCYVIVFFLAYLFMLAVPISNEQLIRNTISHEEVLGDLEKFYEGDFLVNGNELVDFRVLENGNFVIPKEKYEPEFIDYEGPKRIEISEREALERIQNFILINDKYTRNKIYKSPAEILQNKIERVKDSEEYYDDDYYEDPYYDDYYYYDWELEYKLSRIERLHSKSFLSFDYDEYNWFWKISLGIIAWLALLVWMFKQMHLRQFIVGFISLCLTPLAVGLIALILYSFIFGRHDYSEDFISMNLILFTYIGIGILVLRGYLSRKLNNTAYVLSMYFHFFIPLIPVFILAYISIYKSIRYGYWYEDLYWGYSIEDVFNVVYWISIILGLISIALFKPIYAKFRALPSVK